MLGGGQEEVEMSDIPDGADASVARMAIAWEITKEAIKYSHDTRGGAMESDTGRIDVYLELFNKAYFGLKDKAQAG